MTAPRSGAPAPAPPPADDDLWQAAVRAHARGDFAAAIARYRQVLAAAPGHADAAINLAAALRAGGDHDAALAASSAALAIDGSRAQAWFNHANLLRDRGDAAQAEAAYRRALALDATLFQAATNLANLLARQGRTAEAAALHQAALAAAPANLPSLRALARLHYEQGDHAAAEARCREALALAPADADARLTLGVVLRARGRDDEAIACWNAVLRETPDHGAAHNNLGVLRRLMKQPQEAVRHLRIAARRDPHDALTAANLAHALLDLGAVGEARAIAAAVVARHPDSADGHLMLGFAQAYGGEAGPAVASFLEAHRCAPAAGAAISNALFASLYDGERDAATTCALHRELAARIAPAAPARRAWPNPRTPARRLKVGYLSPDLRSHPVASFLEPVLAHHDARAVEVFCYSTTHAPDATTARLRTLAHAWRDCRGMDDAPLAARIAEDGIDILVDLAGHTAQNRAAVLRAKPAPVQALYIGYPGSSGLPEMDWVIADDEVSPPSLDRLYSERVLRLPGSFWCYRPPPDAPAPEAAPRHARGRLTFGSFNALQKLSAAVVALWARVLAAVPGSCLALKSLAFADPPTRAAVARRFAAAGVAPERLVILPPTAPEAFLAEYRQIDIALDPFPYNGGTTTCDALWMGVPVVTLAGDRFCGRMGVSLLHRVGLPDLVAADADAYVRIAAALAADPARLDDLRAGLRARMAASPLCDGRRAAAELEQAYRTMWRDWLDGSRHP
ncbi:MAG: tetratricopeptide repeat protein [Burkholderiales bacterium]|nr:tetratricopeptide repeat protein [Burkholderiales bacterium]